MTPGKPIGIGLGLSLLLATTVCVPLLAGSRAIGTVVGSTNATLESQTALSQRPCFYRPKLDCEGWSCGNLLDSR